MVHELIKLTIIVAFIIIIVAIIRVIIDKLFNYRDENNDHFL